MDRLLARLERRFGRYALPNLILYVAGGMTVIWLLSFSRPEAVSRLTLDFRAVLLRREWWRLATFLFVPLGWPYGEGMLDSSYMAVVGIYFTWWVGTGLEQNWGAFRFNAYYFLGALGAIVAALITGHASNTWLDASLLLAFATSFPDVTILLFFVLPIRVKWLGIVTALFIGLSFVRGGLGTQAGIVAALGNYILFFAGHWLSAWKGRTTMVRQRARREQLQSSAPTLGQRSCSICGAREADGTDIRVCSCEKCGGQPRALCLSHARNH